MEIKNWSTFVRKWIKNDDLTTSYRDNDKKIYLR